jgi:hypothetical protein
MGARHDRLQHTGVTAVVGWEETSQIEAALFFLMLLSFGAELVAHWFIQGFSQWTAMHLW